MEKTGKPTPTREQQFLADLMQLMNSYSDVPLETRYASMHAVCSSSGSRTLQRSDEIAPLFLNVLKQFKQTYGNLAIKGSLVYLNGECMFNTEGYNLLYNLTRLCDILKEEML